MGDFDTKVHRAIEFLEDGDRIKVTVRFRGRELTHPEIGRNLIAKFVERVKDHGVAERTPLLEGKSMHITMASTHKPKSHDAPDRRARGGRDPGRRRGGDAGRTDDDRRRGGPDAAAEADRPQPQTETPAAPAPAPAARRPNPYRPRRCHRRVRPRCRR